MIGGARVAIDRIVRAPMAKKRVPSLDALAGQIVGDVGRAR